MAPAHIRERKEMGLPYRRAAPEAVERALAQARACLKIAPDAAAAMCRKAVQLSAYEITPRNDRRRGPSGTFDGASVGPLPRALGYLKKSGHRSATWLMAGQRVVRLGDKGAHETEAVSPKEARACWNLAKYVLDDLGFDMIDFGDAMSEHRVSLTYELGPVPRWRGPVRFKDSVASLERGGLIDLLYRCPRCKTTILVEDVETSFSGPEGIRDDGLEEGCRKCGLRFLVSATWEHDGWWAEADEMGDGPMGGAITPLNLNRPLPAIGSFLYRIMVDYQDRENDFYERQLEEG